MVKICVPSLFPLGPDDDDDNHGRAYDRMDAEHAVCRDIDISARLVDIYDKVVPAVFGVWVGQSSIGKEGQCQSHGCDLDPPEIASAGHVGDVWCMMMSDAGEQVELDNLQLNEK